MGYYFYFLDAQSSVREHSVILTLPFAAVGLV